MRWGDNELIYGRSVALERVDPRCSRFSAGSVSLVIAQFLLVAPSLKVVLSPFADVVAAALARMHVSLAERDLGTDSAQRAGVRLRKASEMRSERLSVNLGIMEVARHCVRNVWGKASAIVFFHQDSTDADRSGVFMWSFLRGEHSYFDKLIACLPQGSIGRDPTLMRLVEWRTMAVADGNPHNQTKPGEGQ